MLGLIPASYLLGLTGIWSNGIHGTSAYGGRYLLSIYFVIYIGTVAYFAYKRRQSIAIPSKPNWNRRMLISLRSVMLIHWHASTAAVNAAKNNQRLLCAINPGGRSTRSQAGSAIATFPQAPPADDVCNDVIKRGIQALNLQIHGLQSRARVEQQRVTPPLRTAAGHLRRGPQP